MLRLKNQSNKSPSTAHNAIVAALALSCFSALSTPPGLALTKIQEAYQFYQQKKFNDAVSAFDLHLQTHPSDTNAIYYDAICNQQLGRSARALVLYKQVVSLSPGSGIAKYAEQVLVKLDPSFKPSSPSGALPTAQRSTAARSMTTAQTTPSSIQGPDEGSVYYKAVGQDIMIPVEINGRSIQMELDTGAPDVLLGKEQLTEIGIRPPEGLCKGYTSGASNNAQIPYWEINAQVKVGPFTDKNAVVTVLATNDADPLLGQSFLKHFQYSVDRSAHCVRFRRKELASQQSSGYALPFTHRESGNRIIVEGEINGKKGQLMLDTGNAAAGICFNDAAQAAKYGAPVPPDARVVSSHGVSGSGQSYSYQANRVRVGPIDRTNVRVTTEINLSDDEEPLLGHEFFEGWQYTIDMKQKVIHLLRR
ncbi:MAG: retroviral-like aspartic protease family protein [Candidatus Melainabacteria bacterium]|nr:retroviral-like aspartic protease family protein [Candidatus Melainabacteria bacterium]